jgi:hypothetical protein
MNITEDSELSELLQGVSELSPIKRMSELESWALGKGLDSTERGRLVSSLSTFFTRYSQKIDLAQKYVSDVAKVVLLQEDIDKSDRQEMGKSLRSFIECSKNSKAATEYVLSAVDIVGSVIKLDRASESPKAKKSEPPFIEPSVEPVVVTPPPVEPAVAAPPPVELVVSSPQPAEPAVGGPPTAGPAVTTLPTAEPVVSSLPTAEPAVSSLPTAEPAVSSLPTAGPFRTLSASKKLGRPRTTTEFSFKKG